MMWEERSCKQTREWQHWGSGCYDFRCERGRIQVIVANYSYECYYPGQELQIRIYKNGWLHRGSIVCPQCTEICGEEFAERNEKCRPAQEPPSGTYYHRDELKCSGSSVIKLTNILSISLVMIMSIFHFKAI